MDFETSRIWECGSEEVIDRRQRALGRKETEMMMKERKLENDEAIVVWL